MVGPGLQLKKYDQILQSIEWNMGGGCETDREIRILKDPENKKLLHEHPDMMKLLLGHDVYVMFNPGYGSQQLRDAWRPTLQVILLIRN